MRRFLPLMTAAALAAVAPLAGSSAAAQAAMDAKPKKALVLLAPGEIDPGRVLPPPPPEGSARAQEDMQYVKSAIAAATPERFSAAHWDDAHEDADLLTAVLGPSFDVKVLPATAELLSIVQTDAGVEASAAKKLFRRRRPWAVDSSVPKCDVDDKPANSYPSGHGTLAYALALTMAEVLPGQAQPLLARAADYGYSREICGAHFPDDIQAGEALATAIVVKLMTKPEFQAKVAAARTELQAHGLSR